MLRLLALVGIAAAIAALIGPRRLRLAFGVVAGLLVAYAVLKATGVVDAVLPDRTGVL